MLAACLPGVRGARPGTTPAITPSDVRSRIYVIADDSMLGRQSGTVGNFKMTEYLGREAARMGLEPAGDRGTYFQVVPMVMRRPDSSSRLIAGTDTLGIFKDFVPFRPTSTARVGTRIDIAGLQAVFGGRAGDTTVVLDKALVAGKLVVLDAPLGSNGQPTATYTTAGGTEAMKYPGAAGIAIASLDLQSSPQSFQRQGSGISESVVSSRGPGGILITTLAARKLMGRDLGGLNPGATGLPVESRIGFVDSAVKAPARNVVAMRRGTDPFLSSEYVAVGAHSDHIGVASGPVEHDSLRAFNRVMRPEGNQTRAATPTAAQWRTILSLRDSLRKIRPPRMDSIFNGADDDGSGSTALLEIAEQFASQPRGRRSILFVWHTGEESGLLGSMYFTGHTTVPRDKIVAQVNMDMVGRGRKEDTPTGGPLNLQAIGMRRLSTELGDVVDSVNGARTVPWEIDLSFDAPGHAQNRYCRSDHQNYARHGIPIVYFSRGYHQDYHVVTDEAEYIDYDALSRVAGFVHDVVAALANRTDRPRVNRPRPNPLSPCRQ
ncbi:MAG: M28 family peptidase [Gemmatimonadaceae bacterium]|nr:M28 family peptidase [Gemmatimonadaceae bacterium]